jgi:hypothetical protein
VSQQLDSKTSCGVPSVNAVGLDDTAHDVGPLPLMPRYSQSHCWHWFDPVARKSYDAAGPVSAGRFELAKFLPTIQKHLDKQGLDVFWLDLTGLSPADRAAVLQHVKGLELPAKPKLDGPTKRTLARWQQHGMMHREEPHELRSKPYPFPRAQVVTPRFVRSGPWPKAGAVLLPLLIGCGISGAAQTVRTSPSPIDRTAFRVARPGDPWPAAVPPCAVSGDAMHIKELAVYRSPALHDQIARIPERLAAGAMKVTLDQLPRIGARTVARISVSVPIHIEGWISLPVAIQVRSRVELIPGHAWIPARGAVILHGTTGDKALVSSPSPFQLPAEIETLVDCEDLTFSRSTAHISAPRHRTNLITLRSTPIRLHSRPRGPTLLSFIPGSHVTRIEARDGFVRVAAGGRVRDECGHWIDQAAFDGWIDEDDVDQAAMEARDIRVCTLRTERNGTCATREATVVRRSDVILGENPGSDVIGALEPGTRVWLLNTKGNYEAFEFPYEEVIPPGGKRFWIKSADTAAIDACPSG